MKGIDLSGRINLVIVKEKGYERHCEHGDELSCPMKGLDFFGELIVTHHRPVLSFDRFR